MSDKTDGKEDGGGKEASGVDKANTSKNNRSAELERIRQNLAKRSLNVKFDLQGTDYKPIENIGIGAYGVVCSAIHSKSGDRVAIKKIPCVFENLTVAKRTYREIKILKHFKHDNIISIREILKPKENVKDYRDIYVVFDLMESDLHRIIYSGQELSEEHIRYFLYQILRGLKYIHSANVIHRDLKPSNLLVNEDCHLRIGDFGMARGMFYTPNEPSYFMTQYVATRWYRAPEILLSMLEYGTAVDMWSVGCIFAEMIGRKHLFPGKDYRSQIVLILGVLGTPSDAVLKNCHSELLRKMIKGLGKKEPISWEKLFPKASKKSIDLLSKMLVLNPADRISVEKALSHRLLNNYHDPDDEPICVPTFHFDFEKEDMDKTKLREVIMDEVMSFHQPKPPPLSFSAFLRPAPKAEEELSTKTDDVKDEIVSGDVKPQLSTDAGDSQSGDNSSVIIFKTPSSAESKTGNRISPVSVDIGKLQVSASADIEMLSAQSSDGKAMDTQSTDVIIIKTESKEEAKPALDEKIVGAEKDVKTVAAEKKGGNTISEDTKAKVKMALLNANQRRQRAESQSEETKETKPVTAAQRQREREEKRRKKKERALEKVKKTKDKKGAQEHAMALSNQDMELLRRWTVMQNPKPGDYGVSSPPHPAGAASPPQASSNSSNNNNNTSSRNVVGNASTNQLIEINVAGKQGSWSPQSQATGHKPRQILAKTTATTAVTLGTSLNISSSQMNAGGSVIIPSAQLNLSQTNFIPVIAIPSTVTPGKIEIKRIYTASGVTSQTSTTSISSSYQSSDTTKNLLQNAILMRSRGNSSNSPAQSSSSSIAIQDTKPVIENQNFLAADRFSSTAAASSNLLKTEEGVVSKDDKLSPRSQGNDLLDFLNEQLKDSSQGKPSNPGAVDTHTMQSHFQNPGPPFAQRHHMQGEHATFAIGGPSPQDSPQHSITPPPPYSSISPTQDPADQLSRSNSTPVLLRRNSHSPGQPQQPQAERPQRSSMPFATYADPTFSNSFPQNFQSATPNQQGLFPESNFMTGENYQEFNQAITFDTQIPNADMLFQSSSEFASQQQQQQQQGHQHQQHVFGNTGHFSNVNTFPASSENPTSMQFDQNFSGYATSQPARQQNFGVNPNFAAAAGHPQGLNRQHMQGQSGIPYPTQGVGVHVKRSYQPSLPQQHETMEAGPSNAGPSNQDRRLTVNCNQPRKLDPQGDLIALLSKQLSKSGVVDIFPPALTLTPKGTGAGYGVGMDLDNMLTDAQDQAGVRVEQSPLSSSLLADWLDISNFSQADIEAIEREIALQSPMHVSFNDVNM